MRSLLPLACLAALAGCAIIIAPGEDVRLATAFSKETVVGNGQITTERRAVGALGGLEVNGSVQMDVRVGAQPSLQVEADSNLLPLVRTETRGNTLKVWIESGYRSSHGIRVTYTTPQLGQIKSAGSGKLVVNNLNGGALTFSKDGSGESLLSGQVGSLNLQLNGSGNVNAEGLQSGGNANLNLTGSGRVSMGALSADAVNVNLRGSGEMLANGTVKHLNVNLVGSGAANLARLVSQRADLKTSGSGDISARVSNSLVASTTGTGRITVYGNPAQRNITGKNVDLMN